ncbi:hypothetical protein N7523_010271 [Penicillium sp. IBT 18751x]|nr:hypothetical protein N7523_010271 [Penicillium sp. IBT 18751x]
MAKSLESGPKATLKRPLRNGGGAALTMYVRKVQQLQMLRREKRQLLRQLRQLAPALQLSVRECRALRAQVAMLMKLDTMYVISGPKREL